ncbi:HNH endonuclease signature motif containing protein [Pseudoalteromonas sp.]|uniref:HNH endonuclease n=1 Tax=Pseudoalteromonas sp. TaxID=53249 RepID=UPI0025806EED|nr:HNH endonuclease signature motif containing protein [Pseudoalteromonas sp.]
MNEKTMSRKKFMEYHGATNRNDRYGWAFVNHADKVVIFGAWDVHTEPDRALIMSTNWERNELGRKQNAYGEAIEYIGLVENEGYSLKTFPMILGEEYDKKTGTTRAKIKDYIAVVSDMSLEVINGDYYAVGNHDVRVSKKAPSNVAQDVTDIFDTIVEKTERESMVLARIGQGKFRQNVIDAWGNGESCALTLTNIREMLIASHIVPWSKCNSNEQRLDGANGILLCAHIDKLFDAHLLTFVKQGSKFILKLSSKIDPSTLKGLGIEAGYELCTDRLSNLHRERFENYMAEHNSQFFIKSDC